MMPVRSRYWVALACAAAAPACSTGGSASSAAPHRPGAPLFALFDDGVLYGISADGQVFSGEELRTPEPALTRARSISGVPDGMFAGLFGSPPDGYECAALADGQVACRGSDVNGDLVPIQHSACDNPNNACPYDDPSCMRLFGPLTYPCVKDWSPMPGMHDVVQVRGNYGVDRNGRLVGWGKAQAVVQPPRPVRKLADDFAILDDGTLLDRLGGIVAGVANVVDVSGGSSTRASTACALEADGSLWCWGKNTFALVGDGTTTDRNTPTRVGDGFVSIRIGTANACGVMRDRTLSCWGTSFIEGDAPIVGTRCSGEMCVATPTRIAGISGVVQAVPGSWLKPGAPVGEVLTLIDGGRVLRVSNIFSGPVQKVIHPVGL